MGVADNHAQLRLRQLDTGDIRLGQVHIVSDILRIICDATGCGHLLIGEGDGATVKRITGLEYQRKKCAAEPIERIVISRIAQDARTLCHSSALQHMGGTQDVARSDVERIHRQGSCEEDGSLEGRHILWCRYPHIEFAGSTTLYR